MTNAQELIRSIQALPSLPAIVMRVQGLITANAKQAEIARVILQDPAMAARLLRAANSSFFGVRSRIRTVEQALVLLGGHMVRNLLVMTAVHGTLRRLRLAPQFPLPKFWEHSLETAVMTKLLALRVGGCSADDAFVAGLLHDLGKVTLATIFADERSACLVPGAGTTPDGERAVFGHDHVDVGAALAREWKLPDFTIEGIEQHHDVSPPSKLARIVQAADALIHWLDRRRVAEESAKETGIAELEPEPMPDCVRDLLTADDKGMERLRREAETALSEASSIATG
jgi:putative nucleotidyltransferase with HDIG domain